MSLDKFFVLEKWDQFQGLASGVATAEALDRDGEILDYFASKPHFQSWSDSVYQDTGGKSRGNVRLQHDPQKIAGKLNSIEFDDDARCIRVVAEVIDPVAKDLLQAGAIGGFSIGGRYLSRVPQGDGTVRYTAAPAEISLVDRPCLPGATFESVKADGSVVLQKFAKYEKGARQMRYKDCNGSSITNLPPSTRKKIINHLADAHASVPDPNHKVHGFLKKVAGEIGAVEDRSEDNSGQPGDLTSPGTITRLPGRLDTAAPGNKAAGAVPVLKSKCVATASALRRQAAETSNPEQKASCEKIAGFLEDLARSHRGWGGRHPVLFGQ